MTKQEVDPATTVSGQVVRILLEEDARLLGIIVIAVTSDGTEAAAGGQMRAVKRALRRCKEGVTLLTEAVSTAVNDELQKGG